MLISFKLLDSSSEITNKILQSLLPEVRRILSNSQNRIKSKLADVFSSAIKSSPEYNSIVNGTLGYELGLPDGDSRINRLISAWSNNMYVRFNQPQIKASRIISSLSISMVQADLSDVLDSEAAVLIDDRTGSRVDWLYWLSLLGDTTIVKDYEFELGPSPYSRTGGGIMRMGGRWQVPSQYSGTIANNWITRSIDSVEDQVYSILEQSLKESL